MKKLTVEFSDGTTKLLESLASEKRTTKISIIRDALALYYYVYQEVAKKEGYNLSIVSKEDGRVIKDIVLTH